MKTVLITGANRGLGLGFTRHYLAAGCRVFSTARKPDQCAEFLELADTYGERFNPVELDVGSEASVSSLAARLGKEDLDLVINNAGHLADEGFGGWQAETFQAAISVNLVGPALVAQALVPLMKKGSMLINLSSGLASCGLNINPETGLDAYAASKAALNMLTRRLAAKTETRDIIVVAFDPGWVKTRMGGAEAELTVEQSISDLTTSIGRLTRGQSGSFLSREGEPLPW